MSIEHIVPLATGGLTERANLWRSCRECNERKGVQLQAPDPESGEVVNLYHPRMQRWQDHFRWSDDRLLVIGVTPIGRATVAALDLNRPHQIVARQRWVLVGWHPPVDDEQEQRSEHSE
ncbi:MAG: HNH endonuclease [Chloroflexales bacterium]|nr:HNH endonuclease [Chloroflexales bacterium]